jgi:hypothetical protein
MCVCVYVCMCVCVCVYVCNLDSSHLPSSLLYPLYSSISSQHVPFESHNWYRVIYLAMPNAAARLGRCSATQPGRLYSSVTSAIPIGQKAFWAQGQFLRVWRRENLLDSPFFESRTAQATAICCSDDSIPTHILFSKN